MSSFYKMVQELAESFETAARHDGGEFVRLKDEAPEWMADAVHEAHGDKLPDDIVYYMGREVVDHLVDTLDKYSDEDDARDSLLELEPDIYTADLMAWLAGGNLEYVDRVFDELGRDGFTNASNLLQVAQSLHYEEIGAAIIEACSVQADLINEEAAYDEED